MGVGWLLHDYILNCHIFVYLFIFFYLCIYIIYIYIHILCVSMHEYFGSLPPLPSFKNQTFYKKP